MALTDDQAWALVRDAQLEVDELDAARMASILATHRGKPFDQAAIDRLAKAKANLVRLTQAWEKLSRGDV